ncbi:LCP family protein [Micromonospora sp. NBC_01813]|uniref:LCP family protein n=1 Tax=Micromonospora sp. NBC_01813 TaxID=2975988 RepID=UPI002DDC6ECD|nr:LCP family protein [Micromonospora sp. NBC_01813]WSA08090.1 LCP family protein [Micromonospora sp. NBC_01813]
MTGRPDDQQQWHDRPEWPEQPQWAPQPEPPYGQQWPDHQQWIESLRPSATTGAEPMPADTYPDHADSPPTPDATVVVSPAAGGQHRRPQPPRSPRRLRRIALLGITGLVVTALAVAGGIAAVSHHYLGEIERFPDPFAAIPAEQRPAPTPEGLTILLAGIDSQAASATGADSATEPAGRTDSLMVVRLTADRERAYVVSIPRDSWVPIPGHDNFKINSAYALGGVSLAVQTVENVTGLRIDHVALMDLAGLRDLTDAVGGVTVDIPAGTPSLDLHAGWPSGPQRLNGDQAVQYVRQRHGLPEGDFDRMRRHQNYLRAMLTEVLDRDTLTSPRQLGGLLDAATQTVTVDDGLTNDKLRRVALDLHNIRNDVRFVTAPVASTGFVGDQWVMWLDTERGVDFWSAVRNDTLEQYIDRYGADQLDTAVR